MFTPGLYASILNQAFNLPAVHQLTDQKLIDADPNTTRLVKKAEAYFRTLPPEIPEFDHFTPAEWLFRNPAALDVDAPEVVGTLERAAKLITALNTILT